MKRSPHCVIRGGQVPRANGKPYPSLLAIGTLLTWRMEVNGEGICFGASFRRTHAAPIRPSKGRYRMKRNISPGLHASKKIPHSTGDWHFSQMTVLHHETETSLPTENGHFWATNGRNCGFGSFRSGMSGKIGRGDALLYYSRGISSPTSSGSENPTKVRKNLRRNRPIGLPGMISASTFEYYGPFPTFGFRANFCLFPPTHQTEML